jgi:hypothetical protein
MEARAGFEGTAKLIPDVLWRQLDVEYGGWIGRDGNAGLRRPLVCRSSRPRESSSRRLIFLSSVEVIEPLSVACAGE